MNGSDTYDREPLLDAAFKPLEIDIRLHRIPHAKVLHHELGFLMPTEDVGN